MKKQTKFIIAVLTVCLILCAFWFYNERELSLSDFVPEDANRKVQVFISKDGFGATQVETDEHMLASILEAISTTTVTRGPKFYTTKNRSYSVYLYPDGYPTLIIVGSDGRIALAEDLDLDHYQYFEDGEELYTSLELLFGDVS